MTRQCPEIAQALRFQDTLPGKITALADLVFSGGEPALQGLLMLLQDHWDTIVDPSISCPLSFTPEDKAEHQDLEQHWNQGVALMNDVLREIEEHQGWDGWVSHQNYDVMKERLSRCREEFLDCMAKTAEERSQWARV
ncbi:phosphotransferase enzyme family protein [Pyrenophora tritici-repentis]|uniref:Mem-trans domain containing protein n=1 Tax=Pyrenophora tritici-repentis TaxID=45151 RepID=A0A2W1HVH1_9PLEO|nr:hypothetical protein PtrV1_11574 [Pyrenophora tritici-repentis]KAF7444377.1 Mem-trans domain containing protein [Pyrenophora tritici-repentis]KAF7564971.1 Mem-trans domain containing protein [Pyrenophora tritici-repentis]KAG9378617.1 Mem-trans domain containing protein [Pyrenophora tritici-repentis]KAI0578837.1 Mem-trans domain-containing protein [Pyrenophora tritici-repentis]